MDIKYNKGGEYTLQAAIMLSLQRALIGEVSFNLRMIAIDWDEEEEKIELYFYFDKEISNENRESMSCVGAEMASDFSEKTHIVEKCIHLNFADNLPIHMRTAYLRKE